MEVKEALLSLLLVFATGLKRSTSPLPVVVVGMFSLIPVIALVDRFLLASTHCPRGTPNTGPAPEVGGTFSFGLSMDKISKP